MATFGPRSYDTLLAESCYHLKIVGKEALGGDKDARKWITGGFGHNQGIFYQEFWDKQDGIETTNAQRIQQREVAFFEMAEFHMQQLGRCQAELRQIAELKQEMQRAPLAAEIIARRQEWEHQQAEAQRKADQERFAETQRKELERRQNSDDYAKRVAQQHQERAQREAENAAKRAKELAPFMP